MDARRIQDLLSFFPLRFDDDLPNCFCKTTFHFGRDRACDIESLTFDPVNPEPQWQIAQRASKFDGFGDTESMVVETEVLKRGSGCCASHTWTIPAFESVKTASITITLSIPYHSSIKFEASPEQISVLMPAVRNSSAAMIAAASMCVFGRVLPSRDISGSQR